MNKQHLEFSAALTAKEAATRMKVSLSWLAKARMRGDGPPYIQIGRSIRYAEAALLQWMKSRQRMSTSEQKPWQSNQEAAQQPNGCSRCDRQLRNNRPSQYISLHQEEQR